MRRPAPRFTLFPYTTLFRSSGCAWGAELLHGAPSEHLGREREDRKSTRLNSSHLVSSYAVFCLKKKISRHIGRLVVRTGATCLRLVHRLERSRVGTLLSQNRRLPRWVARGSGQPEPGGGIHPGFLAFVGGNALGAKYADEF